MKEKRNRIDRLFEELALKGRKAFMPYITAGYPDLNTTEKIVEVLEEAGADIIELGIPFSDPMADGTTIQNAVRRSLDSGTTPTKIFSMMRKLRKKTAVPVVLMTYYNLVFKYGIERFVKDSVRSGADGLIVPDLPYEESNDLSGICEREDLPLILLVAPTTSSKRFKKIADASKGFIYYVSLSGVTGERQKLAGKLCSKITELKKATEKPICVGFGISTPEQAEKVAGVADGVIIGSAIIKKMESQQQGKRKMLSEVKSFSVKLSCAIHDVKRYDKK